jgi:hypothetical protein
MGFPALHWIGKFFAVLTLGSFFLPWMRIQPSALKKNTLEVVRSTDANSAGFWREMIWMRGGEWGEMWADPADGFSGFQLAFGATAGTQRAKIQTELASVALDKKENRPLLGWLLLIPVLTGLGWAALSIPRVAGIALAIPSVGLFGMYLILRWKIADAYMDRLIAQLQLSVGWWGTLYGMVGLATVCAILLARTRGGWNEARVTMFS